MYVRNLIKSILLIILMLICSCSVNNFQNEVNQPPHWTSNIPLDNDFFIGIGASSKFNKNFINNAKENALMDLSQSILVHISGELNSYSYEGNGMSSEYLSMHSTLKTESLISEYEIVDTFSDNDRYWVYIRVSKKDFYEKINLLYITALNSCKDLYDDANDFKDNGDFDSALICYFDSSKKIEKCKDLPIIIGYQEEAIRTWLDLQKNILSLLNSLELSTENKNLVLNNSKLNSIPIKSNVLFTSNKNKYPVQNLPIKYSINRSQSYFKFANKLTNQYGIVVNNLRDIMLPLNNFTITCSVDFQSYLYKFYDFEMYKDLNIDNFICFQDIYVLLNNQTIDFSSITKNDFLNSISQESISEIKNHLIGKYFDEVKKNSKSNYMIEVNISESENIIESNQIISINLNYKFILTKCTGEKNELNYSFKGVSNTKQSAREFAYKDFLNNMQFSIVPEIKTILMK